MYENLNLEQVKGYLSKSTKAYRVLWVSRDKKNKRIKQLVAREKVYKEQIAKLKKKPKDELRFMEGDGKYYWGVFSYETVLWFCYTYSVTYRQFQLLIMFKYHKFLTYRDLDEWGMDLRRVSGLSKKGLISLLKIPGGGGAKKMFILTELGKSLIDEYCDLINDKIDEERIIKRKSDIEKAKLRRNVS